MHWFAADERGLALGVRQTAVPLGGLIAALVVPQLSRREMRRAASSSSPRCAWSARSSASPSSASRDGEEHELGQETLARTLRDGRLWRLAFGSGVYVYAQIAVIGFGVVFLHDEHGLSEREAALVIAAAQVLAVGVRIGTGRWSDVVGSRIGPLRKVGVVVAGVPRRRSQRLRAARCGCWCRRSRSRAACRWAGTRSRSRLRRSSRARREAALRSASSSRCSPGSAIVAPIVFAATVSRTSWALAFLLAALVPLAGRLSLRPLRGY